MVYARTVLPTGMLGTQLRVCDDEPGVHPEWNEPVLASDGEFFVHWKKSIGFYGESAAYLQHFDAGGNPDAQEWGAGSLRWAYPTLGLDGKTYLSYFTTDEENLHTIWVQRFNRDGTPDGAPLQMGESEAQTCYSTAVAVGDDGRGVVVWEEAVTPWDVWLWGQRFSSSGTKLGQPFQIDSFYSRRALRVFKFEDGGFVIASNQTKNGVYMCYLFDSDGNLEKGPFMIDGVSRTIQGNKSFSCNGKDRFVATCMAIDPDTIYVQVYDRDGNRVGETYAIVPPYYDENTSKMIYLMGYEPSVSMAPDGRFVVTWKELDGLGNLNLLGQLFSRDGEPISAPFQVNDADQWPYSFQISGWRGVSAQNDRILFTWLENRRHRGWDVMAKVTDWDFPGVEEQPIVRDASDWEVLTSIGQRIVLKYEDRPEGFSASVFDAAGRKVDEIRAAGSSGTITWGSGYGSGVYFIRIPFEDSSVTQKVILIR
jgi:hypothetical protein